MGTGGWTDLSGPLGEHQIPTGRTSAGMSSSRAVVECNHPSWTPMRAAPRAEAIVRYESYLRAYPYLRSVRGRSEVVGTYSEEEGGKT